VRDKNRKQPFKRTVPGYGEPLLTTAQRSRHMAAVGRSGTKPELAVRRILSDLGLRYTLRNRDLPGSPDIANRARRLAVFVHGCFWHRHPNCKRATTPKSNRQFWEEKFVANIQRDRRAIDALRRKGFKVSTVWECEVGRGSRVSARLKRILGKD
jgi:DNA mismatch endonuclease (patch repair protein)